MDVRLADAPDIAGLEKLEQPPLERIADRVNFREEDRAAVRQLETPGVDVTVATSLRRSVPSLVGGRWSGPGRGHSHTGGMPALTTTEATERKPPCRQRTSIDCRGLCPASQSGRSPSVATSAVLSGRIDPPRAPDMLISVRH